MNKIRKNGIRAYTIKISWWIKIVYKSWNYYVQTLSKSNIIYYYWTNNYKYRETQTVYIKRRCKSNNESKLDEFADMRPTDNNNTVIYISRIKGDPECFFK